MREQLSLYLAGQLPKDITVYTVNYYKSYDGEIIALLGVVPEWLRPQSGPPPPNSSAEQITLEEITIDKQVFVAGYGPLNKTLMIGREVSGDFE